jgi:prepilin-type N-terminal cleavage/methylation domain-containing protein
LFFLKKILKLNKGSKNILFNKKMNKKGFTLIELLIVVAVIGILASVILVGIGPVQKQGRDARRISDLKQVQNGLELYYNRYGSYPTVTEWDQLSATLINAGVGISNVPKDPSSGRNYFYSSDGTTYCLGAALEDLNNPNWSNSVSCSGISNCYTGAPPATQGSIYCLRL